MLTHGAQNLDQIPAKATKIAAQQMSFLRTIVRHNSKGDAGAYSPGFSQLKGTDDASDGDGQSDEEL